MTEKYNSKILSLGLRWEIIFDFDDTNARNYYEACT